MLDRDDPELRWMTAFFTAPNLIQLKDLGTSKTGPLASFNIDAWIECMRQPASTAPIILPYQLADGTSGWYAVSRKPSGVELEAELKAWFGPTYCDSLRRVRKYDADPLAGVLASRFGGSVVRFSARDEGAAVQIARKVSILARLSIRRPPEERPIIRPIGSIRSDFDRALLVGDHKRANALVVEMRESGRLDAENLKFLDVRFKAGLGLWSEIAYDHWLVKTLSELSLPARVLADLVEALYRTFLEEYETSGDVDQLVAVFRDKLAKPYPALFASRHGVLLPRPVKAFLLFEATQANPSRLIVDDLLALLPVDDRQDGSVFHKLSQFVSEDTPPTEALGDQAFEDDQFDRAFEIFIFLPLTRRTTQKLLNCVTYIGTPEARSRFLDKFDAAPAGVRDSLAAQVRSNVEVIRHLDTPEPPLAPASKPFGWIEWADALSAGNFDHLPDIAAGDLLTWSTTELKTLAVAQHFADQLYNLSGEAAEKARLAVPTLFEAFTSDGFQTTAATKPILTLLIDLIALDATITVPDLELLGLLLSQILGLGLSGAEYVSVLRTFEDVQRHVGSFSSLGWSLDICEALAVAPTPTAEAAAARLQFFRTVVNQAQGSAHRLERYQIRLFEYLAKDYGVAASDLGSIVQQTGDAPAEQTSKLSGRRIAIYTLSETAGVRAAEALKDLFPLVRVDLNSDTVATPRLTNLAKEADIFVFAWKSSSHQAFYCIKSAMSGRDPVMPTGKGSSSIVQAVLGSVASL